MSRFVIIGSNRDPKPESLCDMDIDELVNRLSPGEIQRLLDECDPDDPHIPPSMRTNYRCEKKPTGPFDRKKLLDFIEQEALRTPDVPEIVPFVPGTVRGKKWVPPSQEEAEKQDNKFEFDIDIDDEYGLALNSASVEEIADLAGILGLHSVINQDQYHRSQTDKWSSKDDSFGWNGITKATPLKEYPTELPNQTKPDEVISLLYSNSVDIHVINLNNVVVSEQQFIDIFQALKDNAVVTEFSAANCNLTDSAALSLVSALEVNNVLEKINIESNKVSPPMLVKIFQTANAKDVLKEIRASNQQSRFLGYKAESDITKSIESSKKILKVGLHFEFGDCRNRVALQLQKNLDRYRLKRIAHKLPHFESRATNSLNIAQAETPTSQTDGYLADLPGALQATKQNFFNSEKDFSKTSDN